MILDFLISRLHGGEHISDSASVDDSLLSRLHGGAEYSG